jgi:hypothetical protein
MWARLEDNIVREVIDFDPDGIFHESLVWVACTNEVIENDIYNETTKGFEKPELEV